MGEGVIGAMRPNPRYRLTPDRMDGLWAGYRTAGVTSPGGR